MNEIDRDFYCSANCHRPDGVCELSTIKTNEAGCSCHLMRVVGNGCPCYHRKHPTPEQFKEEYGFEWEGAVYWAYNDGLGWAADDYSNVKLMENPSADFIVCACTPFGRPENDWSPE